MVLAHTITTDQLVETCVTGFRRYSSVVVTTGLAELAGVTAPGTIVVAAELGSADCLIDVDALEDAIPALRILDGRSIALTVIVPVHRMGDAHRKLRGAPVLIQPYWYVGEDLCFGAPELP